MKFLIMQSSPASRHFFSLSSKYYPITIFRNILSLWIIFP